MASLPQYAGWRVLEVFLFCGLSLVVFGCDPQQPEKSPADVNGLNAGEPDRNAPANANGKNDRRPVSDDPETQFQADLDDAISLLKSRNVALFMERYMPLDYLEEVREFTTIEQHAENVKVGGEFEKDWLRNLSAMKKAAVEFQDEEKSKAVIVADISPQETDGPKFSVANPAEEKIPETKGFPGDLKQVLGKAAETLEAGDHQKFVENLFPPAELHITQSKDAMEAMSQRLKEHPDMVKQMLADLKALQKLEPRYNADKTVATFQLNPGTKKERTVRFEKAGTWRMANSARKIREDVYRQSRQPPIGIQDRLTAKWVRIREHWRLNELP